MIIDYSYFIGKINLPQTGNTDGRTEVEGFIEIYEPEYLKKALGYDLWKAFTDGITGSGTPDDRWVSLLEGAEFTYNGQKNYWPGFEAKPSPISQYVYYRNQEDAAEDTTLTGTSTGKTENATRVSPSPKMIAAWNKMVELNVLLWNYIYANRSLYPEWSTTGYYDTWYWPDQVGHCHRNELYTLKNSLDL